MRSNIEPASAEERLLEGVVSLPVPNVQALAAELNELGQIPDRYLRPEMESELLDDGGNDVPVIDLSKLLDPRFSQEESDKLKFACEDWGFFQITNHGVPDAVIDSVKSDIQGFFKLPLEVKNASAQPPGTIEGYGQAFVVSEDQKLDWADFLYLLARPLAQRVDKLWPAQPLTFRSSMDDYSMEIIRVSNTLLRAMSKNLGLDEEKLSVLFDDCHQSMRMNYYPPCPRAGNVIGISPHSDALALTVLMELDELPGLQIKRNGRWMPVKSLANAFIVNIGDALEIMSNGKYKSIEHRAVVHAKKERLSVAAFHHPNSDIPIGPLPELILQEGQECYKTLDQRSYMKLIFSYKLDGKSLLDHVRIQI